MRLPMPWCGAGSGRPDLDSDSSVTLIAVHGLRPCCHSTRSSRYYTENQRQTTHPAVDGRRDDAPMTDGMVSGLQRSQGGAAAWRQLRNQERPATAWFKCSFGLKLAINWCKTGRHSPAHERDLTKLSAGRSFSSYGGHFLP